MAGKDCPKCGMPDVSNNHIMLIKLYQQCKALRCLPFSGGLLEQPYWIYDAFNIINEAENEIKNIQAERQEAEYHRARVEQDRIKKFGA